jgi:hypothetical protein
MANPSAGPFRARSHVGASRAARSVRPGRQAAQALPAGKSWSEGYDLLAPCGRMVAFGLSAVVAGNTRSLLHAAKQLLSVKKWSPTTRRSAAPTWPICAAAQSYSNRSFILCYGCMKKASFHRTSTAHLHSLKPPRRTNTSTHARPRARCCSCRDARFNRARSPAQDLRHRWRRLQSVRRHYRSCLAAQQMNRRPLWHMACPSPRPLEAAHRAPAAPVTVCRPGHRSGTGMPGPPTLPTGRPHLAPGS